MVNKSERSEKKMKILYINSAFYGGGAEKVMRQLYTGLNKKYEIETFSMVGWEKRAKGKLYVIYKDFFWKLINVLLRGNSESARLHDGFAVKQILKMIREYKIDIVHFHNITGDYLGIMDMQKIVMECPVVWTLHDMWAITGHCAYALNCDKWKMVSKSQCNNCRNLKYYPKTTRSRTRQLFNCKRKTFSGKNIVFVTPSKWLRREIKESFLADEKMVTIENGVDCSIYQSLDKLKVRLKNEMPLDKLIFLFAATSLNNPYKGVDVLIEALNGCNCKSKILLVTIGNGKLDGLDDNISVRQFGMINDEKKMNELYALADIFIIPSRAENYPCSILESMASGTPVIGADVGGISEQIEEGTGWLFHSGNAKQLKSIIEDIVKGEYDLGTYGNRCRTIASEKYDERIMLEKYYKLYLEILER